MGISKYKAAAACHKILNEKSNADELGELLSFLRGMPDETLAFLSEESLDEAIVAFLRAEMAGWWHLGWALPNCPQHPSGHPIAVISFCALPL